MKLKIKTGLDIAMTVMLLLQMGYHMTSERSHKWFGIVLSVLFILHHILNWKWYRAIFKGKYSPARFFRTAVNLCLTLSMLGMMASGIMLARDIFGFIPLRAGSFARLLHMSSTAWGFILSALHMGQHWNMAVRAAGKRVDIKKPVLWVMRGGVAIAAVYGLYAFVRRELGKHMFLTVQYAFFDFGEPFGRFLMDYTAVWILYAAVSYYLSKVLALPEKKIAEMEGINEYTFFKGFRSIGNRLWMYGIISRLWHHTGKGRIYPADSEGF